MKVVHVFWQMSIGGAETMVVDIVNAQVDVIDSSIVSVNETVDDSILKGLNPKVSFYCCNRKRHSKSIIPIIKLNYYIWKLNPDIVHCHFGGLYKYIFWTGFKVRTVHNTNNDMSERKRYDVLYAISNSVVEEWKAAGFETVLVVNGIVTNSIKTISDNSRSGILHFVQVSRLLCRQKGQDLLIEAINLLVKQKNYKTDFVMHFIGDGPDGEWLRSRVSDLGLNKFIVFDGKKDRKWIYDNLCNFNLFIQPSRFEGFGLTVAEACAAKLPVLVSDIEGPLEILNGGSLGMTFRNGDVEDLASKLLLFINNGYDKNLIDKAFDYVLSNYDINRTANDYYNQYNKLLSLK